MSFSAVLDGTVRFHVEHGSALECLKLIPDNSVDAVVTDPPAGIKFMGKQWDGAKGGRAQWVAWLSEILAECYRVTKPGGRMLCWSIPRTMHWTGTAIEDAGWLVESVVAHINGSGFPKAKSQLKPSFEGWWLARKPSKNVLPLNIDECRVMYASPSDAAANTSRPASSSREGDSNELPHHRAWGEWEGGKGRWPSNLVLSHSTPIPKSRLRSGLSGELAEVFRKYFGPGDTVPTHAIPAVWSDYFEPDGVAGGCVRVGIKRVKATSLHGEEIVIRRGGVHSSAGGHQAIGREQVNRGYADADGKESVEDWQCVDGCPIAELDRQSGVTTSGAMKHEVPAYEGESNTAFLRGRSGPSNQHGDSGGASRFFNTFESDPDDIATGLFVYQAKASKADRNAGFAGDEPGNTHPTLKSTPLMRHLVKLIAKPGDVVLDAFCGSGSTGRGALLEGCRFIGIEREDTEAEPYVTIARRRIADAESKHNESLLIQGKRKGKAQQDLL